MKKKMMFMIPNAHDALSIAQERSTSKPQVSPETVNNPRSVL